MGRRKVGARAQQQAAPDQHEVGHLMGQLGPSTWQSTFVYRTNGEFRSISSGPVSKREFNMHSLRHRGWTAQYIESGGTIPPEALKWTG